MCKYVYDMIISPIYDTIISPIYYTIKAKKQPQLIIVIIEL